MLCDVYKIQHNGKEYAVKAIFVERIKEREPIDEEINNICTEIKVLYSIKHPNII